MQEIEDQRRAKVTKMIRTKPCGPEGMKAFKSPIRAKGIIQ
jgi:hypothetical protein